MHMVKKVRSAEEDKKKFSRPLLWAISILGILIVAFGVAQPLILRQLGEPKGSDISTADAISILIAVVTILAAGLGFTAFVYAREKATEFARTEMGRVEQDSKSELSNAIARVGLNQAALLWIQLEPLIIYGVIPGSPSELRRKHIIQSGIFVAQQTLTYTDTMDENDKDFARFTMEAKLNLAFYLSCLYWFARDTCREEDHARVFELLPTVREITDGTTLDKLEAGKLQFLESLSWCELCCVAQERQRWDDARKRIASLVHHEKGPLGPLAEIRYVETFGPTFFD
jgi:hypothetical protein